MSPHPVLDHSPALRAAADRAGFTSPARHWQGWHAAHRFTCAGGHTFAAPPAQLLAGRLRCSRCDDHARLDALHELAQDAGVTCTSRAWRGSDAQYDFRCAEGHRWQRRGRYVQQSAGCPICTQERSRKRKMLTAGLRLLRQAARAHGGKCLSSEYQGINQRYRFRCPHGHEWEATGSDVLYKGHWCRLCAHEHKRVAYRLEDGLQRLQQAAAAKGGQCLAHKYQGQASRYRFRCRRGHEWEATGARVLRGSWCLRCTYEDKGQGRRLADGLERLHAEAQQRGGQCLSEADTGSAQHYEFRCAQGHTWRAIGASVLGGAWCRRCSHEARRLGIDTARRIAVERGGQCLSEQYVNCSTPLSWLCHRGHSWQTTMGSILAGHWCPACAHQAQISNACSKARRHYEKSASSSS